MHSHSQLVSATRRILPLAFLIAGALQVGMACNKKDQNQDPKALRGRIVFSANCISCHNSNPSLDGPLGPAIKGSSLELLQARVLHAGYPPGYAPKRPTKMMPKMPLTEANLQDLQAFLNSP